MIGSSPRLFSAAQKLAGIGAKVISPFSEWMWIPAFTGWGYSKDLPRPAMKPFRERFSHRDTKGTNFFSNKKEGTSETDVQEMPKANLMERFTEELTALGGKLYRVSRADLNDRLIELLKERGAEAVLTWDSVEGVDEVRLTGVGVRAVRGVDPTLRAGITGALGAIADTGTLVLPSGEGRPLSASLLPEIHIAVIRASQIVRSLEEALQMKEVREAASVVLISGPSRTADIEMTLTIGVHGPKELIVYMVE
jgi:L-lactate dehydrogenase complex protein LldG